MKRALISIGVNKTASPHFPILTGAATGANSMAHWGKTQGFDVRLFTDDKASVTKNDIFEAIGELLEATVYSQIVIYFSGHGLLQAPSNEIWLLSGALKNPSETISVQQSISNARLSKIEHIVFISDACRSLPKNFVLGGASPGPIFPIGVPTKKGPRVDVFYATLPGDPAYETVTDNTNSKFNGLLTSCLLKALYGDPSTVIERITSDNTVKLVVASGQLQEHLEDAVPKAAQNSNITLIQHPQIIVESRLPQYLSDLTPTAPMENVPIEPEVNESDLQVQSSASSEHPYSSNFWSLGLSRQEQDNLLGSTQLQKSVDEIVASHAHALSRANDQSYRKDHLFRTRHFVFKGLFINRIRYVYEKSPRPIAALIELAGGHGIYLPIFEGFLTTIIGEKGRILTVNYDLVDLLELEGPYYNKDIARSRALAATLARQGRFKLDPELAERTASLLRYHKRLDPILGMFAAYAYSQAGNYAEVLSVYRYMCRDPAPVLFDVALLAAQVPENYAEDGIFNFPPPKHLDFMPGMPLLTQGWLNLGKCEQQMPNVLAKARQYLIPGLWTTFTAEGIAILESELLLSTFYENRLRTRS